MRDSSIDELKFLCAVLIVFLHVSTPYSVWYRSLTSCAVPCFFIISGFFLAERDSSSIKKSIIKILKITAWSSLLFAGLSVLIAIINHQGFMITKEQLLNWIVFNDFPYAIHLWYLYAYLYVLLLFYGLKKLTFKEQHFFYFIPLLLLGDLLLGKYSLLVFGRAFPTCYTRNFIFVGIPYFFIGVYLAFFKESVIKIKQQIWSIGIILSVLIGLTVSSIIRINGFESPRDHMLSTTILAICLFLFFLVKSSSSTFIAEVGRKESLYIYIFHPVFLLLLERFISPLWGAYEYVAPVVVLLCTYLFIICLRQVRIIK